MIYKRGMKKRKTLAVHKERVEEIANESSGRRKNERCGRRGTNKRGQRGGNLDVNTTKVMSSRRRKIPMKKNHKEEKVEKGRSRRRKIKKDKE